MIEDVVTGTEYRLQFINTQYKSDAHRNWIHDSRAEPEDLKYIFNDAMAGDYVIFGFHRGELNESRDVHLSLDRPVEINDKTRKIMKNILSEIQSGKFAREWIRENKKGRPKMNQWRKDAETHEVEKVGRELRDMMPWMKKA